MGFLDEFKRLAHPYEDEDDEDSEQHSECDCKECNCEEDDQSDDDGDSLQCELAKCKPHYLENMAQWRSGRAGAAMERGGAVAPPGVEVRGRKIVMGRQNVGKKCPDF